MERWLAVGFTQAQAELLDQLVTKDYLREFMREFMREYVRDELLPMLREEFVTREFLRQALAQQKRELLLWQAVIVAIVFVLARLNL